ncbi:AGAP006282-PA-like protein [Anopheles sinensis]|uniref:AGAP006282-PA-like protein n=1 Tax=Anopheles sinensis TaxID=74873 RepID=A0A084WKC9_ANOSI|nr:AGAP006282-PA-like protein [Anopheles sinensis]
MCIQTEEIVLRNAGQPSSTGTSHVVPVPTPPPDTKQPMAPTEAAWRLVPGRDDVNDSLAEDIDCDPLASNHSCSRILSRSVAWCSTVYFHLTLALGRSQGSRIATRHRSVSAIFQHHQNERRQQRRRRRRRQRGQLQCQRSCPPEQAPPLAPPEAQAFPTTERYPRKSIRLLPTINGTTKLVLLIMALIAVVGRSEAGTCWLRRFESTGKCNQLFARNVTRESCCAAGSGAKGFSEKDITDVGLFFINAFNDGMECASCVATCDRAKCGPNKRCVMRRNRPKCICAPTCSGGGGGRSPKRYNQLYGARTPKPQTHYRQQNIKVINLSESQRNRRQYFADDGRVQRARQVRYTDPAVGDAQRKNPSLGSESQRASTHRPHPRARSPSRPAPPVNCSAPADAPTDAGCPTSTATPSASSWTGGERMVLLQDAPAAPNGLALNHAPAGKGSGRLKGHPAAAPTTTRRHHRKMLEVANQTMTHHPKDTGKGREHKPTTVTPFAAFGKPKLLRVPKHGGGRQNGTVRVPRREPHYQDDIFFVENYHHRRDSHHPAMDDFLGNEIMQHTNFYNPVCGTDGRTYKTECQLKKRACRQEITSLVVAYKGHCQTSCKFVKCSDGKRCIEDQNATPHCVTCGGAECRSDRSPKSVVCGTDGNTYPSICELKRQACLTGRAIPVAYRGRCIEAATCETIKCKDRQHCLTDLKTHKPRCVSCSYKCPRMKRQQGNGKPFRKAKNNPFGEQSVKLCGTNNRTYHSWCHMQKDSCNTGFYIDVQHSGPCPYGR